ncbi:MAG: hypothetical protein RIC55_25205 [Pirellulaceae bacterium]
MDDCLRFGALCTIVVALLTSPAIAEKLPDKPINIDPRPISADKDVTYDYPIVYVRSPRWVEDRGQRRPARWAEFAHIFNVNPGTDLMLLHPDGKEETLVEGGAGAVQDPYVSFDGEWVYYTHFHEATQGPNKAGADIYKIHVPTRKIVRLTQQQFTPAKPATEQRYGVYNMHPCPLPGGRVAYVSSRNGYLPPPKSYPQVALQLHVMDDDGQNIETIGHLNLAGALHPVILKDGRILFSSLENMGLRNYILWGIWSIHPDGTNWAPVVSALHGHSSPSSWHFQTQLSDETVVVELYYNQNQKGFGSLFTLPPRAPYGESAFGPGNIDDERNPGWDFLGYNGKSFRIPFTPHGMQAITPWIRTNDFPAWPSVKDDQESPRIGKVTHPCGAPDNHLLVGWTLGPIGGSAGAVRDYMTPQPIDSGIYLIKGGKLTSEPGQMLLIKNDPKYNEQWPRPLVSYKRVYGVAEPTRLESKNDGSRSKALPEGTPFGLVGTSSFYKRESAPMGAVESGSVTATFPKDYRGRGWDREDNEFSGTIWNWRGQGADAGRYDNDEIHAVRIVAMAPNTHTDVAGARGGYPPFQNHAMERLRILGEIPLRKFQDGRQPTDPDGNPDTSFLAKIPADVAFTFQTIDKNGMLLNMAQTWHQVRPGEVRHDCGGCHAHSQQPTRFEETFAATDAYKLFDLTEKTPLLTAADNDQSKQQWDAENEAGIRYVEGPHDVEYFRDVKPILERSCVACHSKNSDKPAAGLVLDDDEIIDGVPGAYFRLAADDRARFSPRRVEPRGKGEDVEYVVRDLYSKDSASHYVWKFQSRRSLLVWKLYGRRLDGWSNDTVASEFIAPGDPRREHLHVPRGDFSEESRIYLGDIDYTGSVMPPPQAVKTGKAAALSDEDRRTIVRWIDLGCPIDLDPSYDPTSPTASNGYLADDQRPTLTLTHPAAGDNPRLTRLLIGMHDFESGLDLDSLSVTADFAVDGTAAGENLAGRFIALADHRWELSFDAPIEQLSRGTLTVSIRDARGNTSTIQRTFSVSGK